MSGVLRDRALQFPVLPFFFEERGEPAYLPNTMASFADLPPELIILICELLESTRDLLQLALTSQRIRGISESNLGRLFSRELHAYVSQFSQRYRLQKAIDSGKSRPFVIAGLRALCASYTTNGSLQPNAIPIAMRLVELYEDCERVDEATAVLNNIWTSNFRDVSVPLRTMPAAVALAWKMPVVVKLADIYEKNNRVDEATGILEQAWTESVRCGRISLNAIPTAVKLAELYETKKALTKRLRSWRRFGHQTPLTDRLHWIVFQWR